MTRRTLAALAGATMLLAGAPQASSAAPVPAVGDPRPPLVLPPESDGARAASPGGGWIVGGRPGPATDRVARRFGAAPVLPAAGAYRVAAGRARAMAWALRTAGRLVYAEPDAPARKADRPHDPFTAQTWWRDPVVSESAIPPPVTESTPFMAVIDDPFDEGHPEFAGSNTRNVSSDPLVDSHATAIAGIAGAPDNDVGVIGIWPNMPIRVFFYGECSRLAEGVAAAVAAGASVINMSYGVDAGRRQTDRRRRCYTHYLATQLAVARNIVLVAAAGNEFEEGNPVSYPANDPHVLTVAALNSDLSSSQFSSESTANDVSAPGAELLLPHARTTEDGDPSGYKQTQGTSFAAPAAAAVATWLRAERPALTEYQVREIVRRSSRDLGARGFDVTFGFGIVDIERALAQPAPSHDPLEPNEDIDWVNGSRLRPRPDSLLPTGAGSRTISFARIHKAEDPADVYRLVVPARRSVRVTLRPRGGDPDLEVWSSRARSILGRTGLIGRSNRSRGADSLVIRNRTRRPQTAYVAVYVDPDIRRLEHTYSLSLRR